MARLLGCFGVLSASGVRQTVNFVPLADTSGAPMTVTLSGNATSRTTATGGTDPNYFMLVPTLTPVAASATKNGSNIRISFLSQAGLSYLIHYKNSLPGGAGQTRTTVVCDGAIKSVGHPLTARTQFYQVVAQ